MMIYGVTLTLCRLEVVVREMLIGVRRTGVMVRRDDVSYRLDYYYDYYEFIMVTVG